jgi:hypothetical protein
METPEMSSSGNTHPTAQTPLDRVIEANKKLVALELPAGAIQLLYDVLGHFPYQSGSWANDARARCSIALRDARSA